MKANRAQNFSREVHENGSQGTKQNSLYAFKSASIQFVIFAFYGVNLYIKMSKQ